MNYQVKIVPIFYSVFVHYMGIFDINYPWKSNVISVVPSPDLSCPLLSTLFPHPQEVLPSPPCVPSCPRRTEETKGGESTTGLRRNH